MPRAPGWALAVLLAASPALGGRPPAQLVPADQQLFIYIDVARLRAQAPVDAAGRLEAALAPRLEALGLAAARLQKVVLGGSVKADKAGDKAPGRPDASALLIVEQAGAPPDLWRLRDALAEEDGPRRPGRYRGLAFERGKRVSAANLPGGPALLARGPLFQPAADLFFGRSAAALVTGPAAPLLGRLAPAESPPLSLWLRLPPALQKDLVRRGAPAAPLELAAVGRPDGGGLELRAAGRMAAPADAAALAAWLRARLQALQGETQVQLLGLAGLLRLVEISAEGEEVRCRVPLGRASYADLLDRLAGLGSMLSLRRAPPPGLPSSRPTGEASGR